MFKISLKGLEFYAYHGVYAEEQILGNAYEVNVQLEVLLLKNKGYELKDTVDYGQVYELIKQRMTKAEPLLENLVWDLADSLFTQFNLVNALTLSIQKKQPPLGGLAKAAEVELHVSREDFTKLPHV
ncbi:MAG: dihydroneopterin aldolase [Cytophagales bacterium]|nr:MAG: dihydroneopterin aldolase [Cytophagales bacterium]